jgi:glycosyltransferase involved in cell wall biosynthesis
LEYKNVELLLRGIRKLKQGNKKINCVVVGDGPDKARLENICKMINLEEDVKFTGFVEDIGDVYKLIKSSKVFVLPSTREGFGLVVLEANACGVPVVTINHEDNAARFLIEEGKNGFVCEFNEDDVAAGILRALEKNGEMRQEYLNFVKKFDWDVVVRKLEGVYL